MGWACSTYGEIIGDTGFLWGDMRARDNLKHKRIGEDNIKVNAQEVRWGSMDWIDLAQDTNRWRALVNAVTNIRVL
jgi:hypothetical protein